MKNIRKCADIQLLSRIESQRQPMESRQLKDKLPAS
jgi:hypothetical protein